ncbi:MAG: hypothetical protein HOM11_08240 [Methylococcales bacterium]|jgi:hypothetical protein|nr:hypothetical protein [Methylococcales bacterium]MBT7444725.1 hypothetical protein [Methylococcales bacterium]
MKIKMKSKMKSKMKIKTDHLAPVMALKIAPMKIATAHPVAEKVAA